MNICLKENYFLVTMIYVLIIVAKKQRRLCRFEELSKEILFSCDMVLSGYGNFYLNFVDVKMNFVAIKIAFCLS